MLGRLFLLFTLVTLAEVWLLMTVASAIGWGGTLLMILVTGMLGATLTRRAGLGVLARIRDDLARGRIPAGAATEGILILSAGVMLVTPGVLTDVAGLLLLVPPIRASVGRALSAWAMKRVVPLPGGGVGFGGASPFGGAAFGSGMGPMGGAGPFGGGPFGGGAGPFGAAGRGPGDVIDVAAERSVRPAADARTNDNAPRVVTPEVLLPRE